MASLMPSVRPPCGLAADGVSTPPRKTGGTAGGVGLMPEALARAPATFMPVALGLNRRSP